MAREGIPGWYAGLRFRSHNEVRRPVSVARLDLKRDDEPVIWRSLPPGYHFGLARPGTYMTKFADNGCPDDSGRGGEEKITAAVKAANSHRSGKRSSTGSAA